jgi:hypothetical protein
MITEGYLAQHGIGKRGMKGPALLLADADSRSIVNDLAWGPTVDRHKDGAAARGDLS